MSTVAILFARADSIYKTLPDCDVWDIERDARKWPGGCQVVAHPPCRAWGRLKHFARPRADEKDLAVWAVAQVRKWGGVLEHPAGSSLWPVVGLPAFGCCDQHGGWTLPILQQSFGHRAAKKTLLYIVGCKPSSIPALPLILGDAPCIVGTSCRRDDGTKIRRGDPRFRMEVTKKEREHTPKDLAIWLCELARRCKIDVSAKSA